MRIVIALTSFKGTLTATEACQIIGGAFRETLPQASTEVLPLSDGGDGFLDAISERLPVTKIPLSVTGPLGQTIESVYLLETKGQKKIAFIESARIFGLALVPPKKRNPMTTTTYGLGEIIQQLLKAGIDAIYVGLGGSATQDGGSGMAQALGAKLLDSHKTQIGFGAGWLKALRTVDIRDLNSRIKKTKIFALTDVNNPLLGDSGTARVYAPQKGASSEQVEIIEKNLSHFADVIQKDLKVNVRNVRGAGAAGGLGAGMVAFCGARILPGLATVVEITGAQKVIAQSDIVIVGEGRLDSQSLYSKAAKGISDIARAHKKKILGVFGGIDSEPKNLPQQLGLSTWVSLSKIAGSREKAMSQAKDVLRQAALKLAAKDFG